MLPTGDEPYYLLTTHSMVVDRDISIGENHKNRDYRHFYPGILPGRATVGADGVRVIPAQGIGLSFFLVPFYYVGTRLFPESLVPFLRLSICAIASLCVFFLLKLAKHIDPSSNLGLHWILGISLASPFLFYSNLFYPEIFACFFMLLAMHELFQTEKHPLRAAIVLACIPALLIWFHPKYLVLGIGVLSIAAHRFFRLGSEPNDKIKKGIPYFYMVISLAGMLSFFLFLHREYGSWSPDIIYGGDRRDVGMLEILRQEGVKRLYIMIRMFFGFWIDQRFGIVPYAPIYLAAIPAFFWVLKKRKTEAYPALILFLIHGLILSWSSPLGGFAPPSRHFVVIIPLLSIPTLLLIQNWDSNQRILFRILKWIGLGIALLMLLRYRMIFSNVTWRNPEELSPFWEWLHLANWIPQVTRIQPNYVLLACWLSGIVLLCFLLYPKASTQQGDKKIP